MQRKYTDEELTKGLEKIRAAIDDPSDSEEIQNIQKELKRAMVKGNLAKHDGIKLLIEYYRSQVVEINIQLANNRDLTEKERDRFFERKSWINDLIGFFDVKQVVQEAEELVDNES